MGGMDMAASIHQYAALGDLFLAVILFISVSCWIRHKQKTFLRLMMTSSPQYDFIKGQIMTYLTENAQSLHDSIFTSINNEGDSPEGSLLNLLKSLYERFDPIRRSKFGRVKFERALHFAIKTKLISHPLDLMGSRSVITIARHHHWYPQERCCTRGSRC